MSTEATFAPRHALTAPRIKPPTRLRMVAGLVRLAWFLLTHPSAPLPSGRMNIRVPDAPREMRLAFLGEVADAYRTKRQARFGCLVAERRFGPVIVEAHVKDEDYTRQLIALQDEQAAQAAGSETTA
jgi:hypothetical protein